MKYADIRHLFKDCREVLTVRETAQTVRCSEGHILRLIHTDALPCFQVGRQFRVLKRDVIMCLKKDL